MVAVGIDIVNIDRIEALSDGVRARLFHPNELAEAATLTEGGAAQFLAGRFAAKEALGKALGVGLAALHPATVWVKRQEGGQPLFVLEEPAVTLVGARTIALSISHDTPVAVAVVVLTGGDNGPK
jgi:holo-[acyl-carrier protein] synthase